MVNNYLIKDAQHPRLAVSDPQDLGLGAPSEQASSCWQRSILPLSSQETVDDTLWGPLA